MKAKKLKKELRSMVELKEFLKKPSPKVKVPLYTEIEVIQTTTNFGDDTVKKSRNRLTLAKLAEKIDNLGNDLRNEMNDGFKQVNARIDRIDARLDYIVKANNLKDSK